MAKKNFNFKKINLDLGKVDLSKMDLGKVDLSNLKESITDTISTVADKVLDFADTAAEKSKIGQQIAKLYVEKKKEESALDAAYKELGKLYYELHKTESEGVLADLCMEIENTLINIEDINTEIEGLKASSEVDFDEDDMVIDMDPDEEEGFLERMADAAEEALEGLDEAIEAALDKLEAVVDPEIEEDVDDDEIEVLVEEYLDDDDFVAPEQDDDLEVEIIEIDDEDIFVEE